MRRHQELDEEEEKEGKVSLAPWNARYSESRRPDAAISRLKHTGELLSCGTAAAESRFARADLRCITRELSFLSLDVRVHRGKKAGPMAILFFPGIPNQPRSLHTGVPIRGDQNSTSFERTP